MYSMSKVHGIVTQAQTKDDFYRSVDHGVTWTNIGGPGTFSDTRYMVYGGACEGILVFAFDSLGGLYRFVDDAFSHGNDRVLSQSIGTKHVAANSTISIPVALTLPSNRSLDTMNITEIDYTLTYNGDLLDVDQRHLLARITPPIGCTILDASISSGTISVQIANTNGQTLNNSVQVGSILFDTYSGKEKNTLVSIGSFVIRTKNRATYYYCTGFEGDYLGLIVIDGSGVASSLVADVISLYPNPAKNGSIKLRFSLSNSARIKGGVFDLLGNKVEGVLLDGSDRQFTAGSHEIECDTRALAAGVYYLRLDHAGEILTKKFSVVR
jgi:hypothetical protein